MSAVYYNIITPAVVVARYRRVLLPCARARPRLARNNISHRHRACVCKRESELVGVRVVTSFQHARRRAVVPPLIRARGRRRHSCARHTRVANYFRKYIDESPEFASLLLFVRGRPCPFLSDITGGPDNALVVFRRPRRKRTSVITVPAQFPGAFYEPPAVVMFELPLRRVRFGHDT